MSEMNHKHVEQCDSLHRLKEAFIEMQRDNVSDSSLFSLRMRVIINYLYVIFPILFSFCSLNLTLNISYFILILFSQLNIKNT